MTQIHWLKDISGAFSTAADWSGGAVPGAGDDAILNAAGAPAYTVTASTSETVNSIQTADNATLDITGGTFTANAGTGSGANAGVIKIEQGSQFTVQGTMDNTGAIMIEVGGATGNPTLEIGAAGATLRGGGAVHLTSSLTNGTSFIGGANGATLTNVDNTISGPGSVEVATLVNETKGVIDATSTVGLGTVIVSTSIANTGVLEASGGGLLDITGNFGAAITISGSGGRIIADAGSTVDLTGDATDQGAETNALVTAATGVIDIHAFDVEGTISNAGTINVSADGALSISALGATLAGGGTLKLQGGILSAGPGATLTNIDNTISGVGGVYASLINEAAGVVEGGVAGGPDAREEPLTFFASSTNDGLLEGADLVFQAVTIDQSATGIIAAGGGGRVTFEDNDVEHDYGSSTVVGGTLEVVGTGVMNLDGAILDGRAAAVKIVGSTRIANIVSSRTATAAIEGMIDDTGSIALLVGRGATDLIVEAGGATLTGGGRVTLADSESVAVEGATASATLTNFNDTIIGGGLLGNGQMKLLNDAAGVIAGGVGDTLVIDTGANAIINSGTIEALAGAAVTVTSGVINGGVIAASGGALTFDKAVLGKGSARIGNGGALGFTSTFDENVTFVGSTGVLELAHSQAYTATITGLSHSGTSSLDLGDIGFISGVTTATFIDNGKHTGGVLTVTDGTHTAHINLAGDYVGSTFTTSSDSHGGTTVVDPGATASGAVHGFAAAMAGLGAPAAGSVGAASESWRAAPSPLAAPRAQIA